MSRPRKWSVVPILFKPTEAGLLAIPLQILGVGEIGAFEPGKFYYGPERPDIAFVHVKARELPALKLDLETPLEEGLEVATAGFPMGTDALMAPGWLHQITPTLQRGIVSAVMPFACPTPHGFAIDVMTQGGASGSPVFVPETGKAIGVLHAGLIDLGLTAKKEIVRIPTSISHVVPAHYLERSLELVESNPQCTLPEDALSLDEMIAGAEIQNHFEERKTGGKLKEVRNRTDSGRLVVTRTNRPHPR